VQVFWVKDVRVEVGFWAKNALATRCQILDARIFERKTKVAGLEKCLKVGKITKIYMKLTKICETALE
jgi:hypothetical protein